MGLRLKGFSLMELMIVVVIIAILVAIALPNYMGMKERDFDKDAGANLKLIVAAQKIYRMETGNYYNAANTTQVNDNLRLSLPTGPNRIWDYLTNTAAASQVCAQANRFSSNPSINRTMRLNTGDSDVQGGYSEGNFACP